MPQSSPHTYALGLVFRLALTSMRLSTPSLESPESLDSSLAYVATRTGRVGHILRARVGGVAGGRLSTVVEPKRRALGAHGKTVHRQEARRPRVERGDGVGSLHQGRVPKHPRLRRRGRARVRGRGRLRVPCRDERVTMSESPACLCSDIGKLSCWAVRVGGSRCEGLELGKIDP